MNIGWIVARSCTIGKVGNSRSDPHAERLFLKANFASSSISQGSNSRLKDTILIKDDFSAIFQVCDKLHGVPIGSWALVLPVIHGITIIVYIIVLRGTGPPPLAIQQDAKE